MASSFNGSSISSCAPPVAGLNVTLMRSLGATDPSLAMAVLLVIRALRPVQVRLRGRGGRACDKPLPCAPERQEPEAAIRNSCARDAALPAQDQAPRHSGLSPAGFGRGFRVGSWQVRISWR